MRLLCLMFVPTIVSLLCLLLLCFPAWAVEQLDDSTGIQTEDFSNPVDAFQNKLRQMVEQQLKARGIQDLAVLKAMSKVPRHRFVVPSFDRIAYEDFPLPLAHDQTISQPYIVAYMTEAAKIRASDRVLEIGTGSGYQAAVLGELARVVYTALNYSGAS